MIKRAADWDVRLVAVEERIRDWAFVWGQHDCALATLLVLEEITGSRIQPGDGETWESSLGAVRFIRRHGMKSLSELADYLAQKNGMRKIKPVMACRGDVVLAGEGIDERLGWIGSDGMPTFVAADGFIRMPLRGLRYAWLVP